MFGSPLSHRSWNDPAKKILATTALMLGIAAAAASPAMADNTPPAAPLDNTPPVAPLDNIPPVAP